MVVLFHTANSGRMKTFLCSFYLQFALYRVHGFLILTMRPAFPPFAKREDV